MFVVHSTHALSWPTLNFRLKKGENRFPSTEDIPAEVRKKLDFLSKAKKSRDGLRIPAVVRFYESAGGPVAPAVAEATEDVVLTPEGLSRLNMKDLQAVADKLEIDHKGVTSKQGLRDKILAEANGTAGGGAEPVVVEETDEDGDIDTDDDT
jgi:hypothetical protein